MADTHSDNEFNLNSFEYFPTPQELGCFQSVTSMYACQEKAMSHNGKMLFLTKLSDLSVVFMMPSNDQHFYIRGHGFPPEKSCCHRFGYTEILLVSEECAGDSWIDWHQQ